MVIHEESESPVEISVIRKPAILEPQKYVMVSNHVREIPNYIGEQTNDNPVSDRLVETAENVSSKPSKKKAKKRKIVSSGEDSDATHISNSDLTELRTIYHKCLEVINKIETKYGHLLNIEKPGYRKTLEAEQLDDEQVCSCTKNKKIVFDDDGTQHTIEVPDEDHICPTISKKLLPVVSQKCGVEEDFEDYISTIPDDLPSLSKMLHDPELSLHNRNKIVQKMNTIKFDNNHEIRFHRPALIQSIKQDPDLVLGFKALGLTLSMLQC
ncbi:hypothetical protein MSG28_011765 [Choristoneura fumiferana]|uniref:Uncharacterized protein n=1 Tax=Choristoneura fumiferana TaxID=7141 RepID=A0ACC0KMH9_CHOFU|nr:hypothetical protein MSG28_011765 [Choristoneura fumiferana]